MQSFGEFFGNLSGMFSGDQNTYSLKSYRINNVLVNRSARGFLIQHYAPRSQSFIQRKKQTVFAAHGQSLAPQSNTASQGVSPVATHGNVKTVMVQPKDSPSGIEESAQAFNFEAKTQPVVFIDCRTTAHNLSHLVTPAGADKTLSPVRPATAHSRPTTPSVGKSVTEELSSDGGCDDCIESIGFSSVCCCPCYTICCCSCYTSHCILDAVFLRPGERILACINEGECCFAVEERNSACANLWKTVSAGVCLVGGVAGYLTAVPSGIMHRLVTSEDKEAPKKITTIAKVNAKGETAVLGHAKVVDPSKLPSSGKEKAAESKVFSSHGGIRPLSAAARRYMAAERNGTPKPGSDKSGTALINSAMTVTAAQLNTKPKSARKELAPAPTATNNPPRHGHNRVTSVGARGSVILMFQQLTVKAPDESNNKPPTPPSMTRME